MDKGPHIIPLVPGKIPVVIHASQNEGTSDEYWIGAKTRPAEYDICFYLLEDGNKYHAFTVNDDLSGVQGDAAHPADFHYVRPDGHEDTIKMSLSRDWYYIIDSGGNRTYSEPYKVFLQDLPTDVTAVAGDVNCEILVYKGSDPSNGVIRSANFILRVEPKAYPESFTFFGGNGTEISESDKKYSSDEERAALTPSYFGSDPVDESLITWAEVVETANNGDLTELLTPGQEIRAEMLTTGQYMGIRCIHVEDYKTAFFESKYLFKAPSKYTEPSLTIRAGQRLPDNEYFGRNAAIYWAETRVERDGYYAPEILPYSIKSVSKMMVPRCVQIYGRESSQPYDFYEYDIVPSIYQLDYYSTTAGRIHKTNDGVAREWITYDDDVKLNVNENGSFWLKADYNYYVGENGNLTRQPVDYRGDIYVPLMWKLVGEEHEIPKADASTWPNVKALAAAGKLKKSTLAVGQTMPALPTVGVLRCVHIEETWAAFDFATLFKTYECRSYASALNQTHNLILTEEEQAIFTKLVSQGTNVWYAHPLTQKNLGISETGASGGFNEILGGVLLDAYSSKTKESRKKTNRNGTPVEWWAYSTGSWDWNTLVGYWFDENGEIQSQSINTNNNPVKYVNGLLVVGNLQ